MANRLYPPVIEGVIPAFYGNALTVPFVMNKSVSTDEVKGFALKMKTIISGDNPIGEVVNSTEYNFDSNIVIFNLTTEQADKLYEGQFYKIQIAYIDTKNIVGYYSTIGVIKYTYQPTVDIQPHGDGITFSGIYSSQDYSEKAYTYNFTLTDNLGNIIETTGDKLHNGSTDTDDDNSVDTYVIKTTLEINQEYKLIYSVTTINGIVCTRSPLSISHIGGVSSNLRANVKCTLDDENGCIDISLVKPDGDLRETPAVGTFYLLRASDEDDFKVWNVVLKFVLYGQTPSRHLWTDMSIKHGTTYKYAVQQVNRYGLRSGLNESQAITASFDHMYLYDGERQLKIKYNPKVSTFKNTLLESKVDTIGSKYPFIFRNGSVNYKEFSISGLVSYLSDDNSLFYNLEKLFEEKGLFMTDLTSDNIATERAFKLEVLNWLTNGKPKLFRSPTEGNYIVRLMNSSMTPNDTVGRMLHTFTSTAYEIAENTYENLQKFNFVHANIDIKPQLRWQSIELKNAQMKKNLLNGRTAVAIKLEGMLPGDKIEMIVDGTKQIFAIGATGYYEIDLNNQVNITSFMLPKIEVPYMGILTYAYYSSEFEDSFDAIYDVKKGYVPGHQFIGAYENILNEIIDIKTEINSIDFIRFILRNDDSMEIYQPDASKSEYFFDEACSDDSKIDISAYTDLFKVYTSYIENEDKIKIWDKNIYKWMDGYNDIEVDPENINNTKVIINDDEKASIDLVDIWVYELKNPPDIKSIKTGSAVITELCYTTKNITYDVEVKKGENDSRTEAMKNALTEYNNLKEKYFNKKIISENLNYKQIKDIKKQCKIAYENLLKQIKQELGIEEVSDEPING